MGKVKKINRKELSGLRKETNSAPVNIKEVKKEKKMKRDKMQRLEKTNIVEDSEEDSEVEFSDSEEQPKERVKTFSNLSLAVTVVDPDREHYTVPRNVLNFVEQIFDSEGRAPWTYDQASTNFGYQRPNGTRVSNRLMPANPFVVDV